jgi:predicted nucleic acid-binding protein
VKLLIGELGSETARHTWTTASERASSLLLYVEARAGIARAVRTARLSSGAAQSARALANELWAETTAVAVTEQLVTRAAGLATEHGLRGYDAVHLASFEAIEDADSVLVASDGALLRAAERCGFTTVALAA